MIVSLGQGEPSYIPDGLMGQAHDFADITYLAFLQCYARDLEQWEIVCFFSNHQQDWCRIDVLADELGQAPAQLAARLSKMADARLLDERILVTGPEYRLTTSPDLRRLAVRLGSEWRCVAQAG